MKVDVLSVNQALADYLIGCVDHNTHGDWAHSHGHDGDLAFFTVFNGSNEVAITLCFTNFK